MTGSTEHVYGVFVLFVSTCKRADSAVCACRSCFIAISTWIENNNFFHRFFWAFIGLRNKSNRTVGSIFCLNRNSGNSVRALPMVQSKIIQPDQANILMQKKSVEWENGNLFKKQTFELKHFMINFRSVCPLNCTQKYAKKYFGNQQLDWCKNKWIFWRIFGLIPFVLLMILFPFMGVFSPSVWWVLFSKNTSLQFFYQASNPIDASALKKYWIFDSKLGTKLISIMSLIRLISCDTCSLFNTNPHANCTLTMRFIKYDQTE